MKGLVTSRLVLHPLRADEATAVVQAAHCESEYPTDMDVEGAMDFLANVQRHGDVQPFGAYEIRARTDYENSASNAYWSARA